MSETYDWDGFQISTDKSRLDAQMVHRYLSGETYWAAGRTFETVVKSMENSLCFGVYAPGGEQVGFARVVTDFATFAWLCDLFIIDEYQGRGLSKWLVRTIGERPDLQVKRFLLATRDAHELYRFYGGFQNLHSPEKYMERPTAGL